MRDDGVSKIKDTILHEYLILEKGILEEDNSRFTTWDLRQ
jgi:hypothetical protein